MQPLKSLAHGHRETSCFLGVPRLQANVGAVLCRKTWQGVKGICRLERALLSGVPGSSELTSRLLGTVETMTTRF